MALSGGDEMTERQLKRFAHEIKSFGGVVPDRYRLMFAYAVRDVVQTTKDFPDWSSFLKMCGLEDKIYPDPLHDKGV